MRARKVERRHWGAIGSSIVGLAIAISVGSEPSLWGTDPNPWGAHLEDVLRREAIWAHAHAISHDFAVAASVLFLVAAALPFALLLRRSRTAEVSLEAGSVRIGRTPQLPVDWAPHRRRSLEDLRSDCERDVTR